MSPRVLGLLLLGVALALLGVTLADEGHAVDRVSVLLWIAAAAGAGLSIWALVSPVDRASGRRLFAGVALLVVAAGSGRRDWLWLGAAGVVIALALLVTARWDEARRGFDRRTAPAAVTLASLGLGLAGALAVGAGVGVPRLYDIITHAFDSDDSTTTTTGLDGALELGALDRLLQSQRVVLRVEGPAPDRLRGVVYDRYLRGRWRAAADPARRATVEANLPRSAAGVVTAHRVAPARHLVVPLDATEVGTAAGRLRRDRFGVIRGLPDDDPSSWWWRSGGSSLFRVGPPSENDLSIDAALAARLRPLAESWAPATLPPAERLRQLETHLAREYRYSLQFAREGSDDPVVEFLFARRTGHCEYFASALALLARSIGVPARVVTGYRVAERSAVGGHYIVRDENAHAWVEAWLGEGGGWRTFDGTPAGNPPQDQPRTGDWWSGLADWLRKLVSNLVERFSGLGPFGWLIVAGVLATGFFAQRLLRRLWRGRRRGVPTRAHAWSPPLPAYARVEARLSRAGHRRAPSETLESFAARLRADTSPLARAAADPILAYAALRYGAAGDRAAVEQRLAAISDDR